MISLLRRLRIRAECLYIRGNPGKQMWYNELQEAHRPSKKLHAFVVKKVGRSVMY